MNTIVIVCIYGYFFQMAKRCSLNDVIHGYLKKAKYEKTLKLFERKCNKEVDVKLWDKFINYMKKKETQKAIEEDLLGFEINFGAYQSVAKVSLH